jgi:hypothetical protein
VRGVQAGKRRVFTGLTSACILFAGRKWCVTNAVAEFTRCCLVGDSASVLGPVIGSVN